MNVYRGEKTKIEEGVNVLNSEREETGQPQLNSKKGKRKNIEISY